MFIKPADGLYIRDPFKRDFLPPEGRDVDADDLYWTRLARDGDVTIVEPVAAKSADKRKATEPTPE
jgi:hypothetical protein